MRLAALRFGPLSLALALVACAVAPSTKAPVSSTAPKPGANAAAPAREGPPAGGVGAAKPPTAGATQLAPVAGGHAGVAALKPAAGVALPLRLLPPLPASLVGTQGASLLVNNKLLANDGSSLIANDGGGLIANDGSSLVANDGAGVLAGGAGNYRLMAEAGASGAADGTASVAVSPEYAASTPWEIQVGLDVQGQATKLMSQAYCIDQILAQWAAAKPQLGQWLRFSAKPSTFTDQTQLAAFGALVPERHFAALARATAAGGLEAAIFVVPTPEAEPLPQQQVLSLQAEKAGQAVVVFSGGDLFNREGSPFVVQQGGRYQVDLKSGRLQGEGAFAFSIKAPLTGEAQLLYEQRLTWALVKGDKALQLASSKAHILPPKGMGGVGKPKGPTYAFGTQLAVSLLPGGRGAFWFRRGLAEVGQPMKLSYASQEGASVEVPILPEIAPSAWFLGADGASVVPTDDLLPLVPGAEAAAAAPMPNTALRPIGELPFPFSWSPKPGDATP